LAVGRIPLWTRLMLWMEKDREIKAGESSGHYCKKCGTETFITDYAYRFDEKGGEVNKALRVDICKNYSRIRGRSTGHYLRTEKYNVAVPDPTKESDA
ncbi:hypothetical protein LCGC14_2099840, partial [marine sediment metagenome]